MTIEFFNAPLIILYAILFGVTMKIADLLNEHKLKWFKGAKIIFGILWGGFGLLLIFSHPILANIIFACTIAFLLRNRLDYFNHQLASTIIILGFIISKNFRLEIFIIFLMVFYIFGSIKDLNDKRKKVKNNFFKFMELAPYGPIATLIYSIATQEWIIFFTWTIAVITYDLTKHIANKKGYK